jgi:hypothetical protein
MDGPPATYRLQAHSDAYLLANVSDPYKVAVQCVLDRKRAHPKARSVIEYLMPPCQVCLSLDYWVPNACTEAVQQLVAMWSLSDESADLYVAVSHSLCSRCIIQLTRCPCTPPQCRLLPVRLHLSAGDRHSLEQGTAWQGLVRCC